MRRINAVIHISSGDKMEHFLASEMAWLGMPCEFYYPPLYLLNLFYIILIPKILLNSICSNFSFVVRVLSV